MSALRQVVCFAQDSIGPPRNDVRDTRRDLETASRARVGLGRVGGRERLHVPEAVVLRLHMLVAEQRPAEIQLVRLWHAPTPSTVRTGHGL
jgi:hypothetical protein